MGVFMKFNLLEAKSVGTIFHFTSWVGLAKILKSNKLRFPYQYDYISFTRDPALWNHNESAYWGLYRITVDGNKLSNKYKIEPFDYFHDNRGIKYPKGSMLAHPYPDEMEERVMSEIDNVKNYIIQVDFCLEWNPYMTTTEQDSALAYQKAYFILAKEHPEIKFNIVSKFTALNFQNRFLSKPKKKTKVKAYEI